MGELLQGDGHDLFIPAYAAPQLPAGHA